MRTKDNSRLRMRRKNSGFSRVKILMIVFFLSVTVFLVTKRMFHPSAPESAPIEPKMKIERIELPPSQPEKINPPDIEIEIKKEEETMPNPFSSPLTNVQPEENLPESKALTVSGIIYQDERAAAIINNEIVRVGDVIDGREVVAIKGKSVVVKEANVQYILRMR